MKLKEIIKNSNLTNLNGLPLELEIKGITSNSKKVKNNFIFIAIKGPKEDGHSFINEAIDKGAKVIIAEDTLQSKGKDEVIFIKVKDSRIALAEFASSFYSNPSLEMKVIGITGTNGKTTISYLLEAFIKNSGFNPAVIGTINYRFKDKVIAAGNTTPGPLELQSMFSEMSKYNVDYVVMEVSSHALDQKRTAGINFHSAIFTNLTQDHLDYHLNLENYFLSKAKLFQELANDSLAVINLDDSYAERLIKLSKAKIVTYAIEKKADFMAKDIKSSIQKTEFILSALNREVLIKTNLIGRHNIYNILAALAWGLSEGFKVDLLRKTIEGFSHVPGRLERIDSSKGFSVFIDYAHTEDALKNVIISLGNLKPRRIIVVFGCGGERDRTKRPKMGRVVSELADYAIITSDNPRSEDPLLIIEDIKKGIAKDNYSVIPDREEAIRKSLSLAQRNDIILLAGKGHEDYQIFKDSAKHFDDKEVVKRCLELKI
jgi:UDP-N-acetylmuramoyl-L-alanyl-D-glutamate--2,6-diaminopimelate ligase